MNPMVMAAAAQAAPKIMDRMIPVYKTLFFTVLAMGGGYFIYRKIKGSTKETPGNDLSRLSIDKSRLTYSESEYGLMAQRLFLAMDRIGYDSGVVLSVMGSMCTRDDLLMLIKTFGIRRYGIITSLFFGQDLNLIGWFVEELNDGDSARVGGIFRTFNIPF
jgi:hypothetical protein